jgi:hypothetical protein
MNILVISSPRSRSSYFCDHLSKFYDIENHHEIYDFRQKTLQLYKRNQMLKNTNFLDTLVKHQLNHLETSTQEVWSNSSINKLFPRHFICNNNESNLDISDITNFEFRILPNCLEIIKISDYDQIYVLERNLSEIVASFLYAYNTQNFLYSNKLDLEYVAKKFTKLEFTPNQYSAANYLIFENIILQKVKESLAMKTIDFTTLDYKEIPNFIDKNFKSPIVNTYLKSELDYSKIYQNFDELVEYCKKTKILLEEKFSNLKLI